jgi:hypothetical protein
VKRKFLDKVVLPSWWEDSISATPGGLREAAGYICAHQTPSLPVPRPAGRLHPREANSCQTCG